MNYVVLLSFSILFLTITLVSFPVAVTKYPKKSNLGKKGLIVV